MSTVPVIVGSAEVRLMVWKLPRGPMAKLIVTRPGGLLAVVMADRRVPGPVLSAADETTSVAGASRSSRTSSRGAETCGVRRRDARPAVRGSLVMALFLLNRSVIHFGPGRHRMRDIICHL